MRDDERLLRVQKPISCGETVDATTAVNIPLTPRTSMETFPCENPLRMAKAARETTAKPQGYSSVPDRSCARLMLMNTVIYTDSIPNVALLTDVKRAGRMPEPKVARKSW